MIQYRVKKTFLSYCPPLHISAIISCSHSQYHLDIVSFTTQIPIWGLGGGEGRERGIWGIYVEIAEALILDCLTEHVIRSENSKHMILFYKAFPRITIYPHKSEFYTNTNSLHHPRWDNFPSFKNTLPSVGSWRYLGIK